MHHRYRPLSKSIYKVSMHDLQLENHGLERIGSSFRHPTIHGTPLIGTTTEPGSEF